MSTPIPARSRHSPRWPRRSANRRPLYAPRPPLRRPWPRTGRRAAARRQRPVLPSVTRRTPPAPPPTLAHQLLSEFLGAGGQPASSQISRESGRVGRSSQSNLPRHYASPSRTTHSVAARSRTRCPARQARMKKIEMRAFGDPVTSACTKPRPSERYGWCGRRLPLTSWECATQKQRRHGPVGDDAALSAGHFWVGVASGIITQSNGLGARQS